MYVSILRAENVIVIMSSRWKWYFVRKKERKKERGGTRFVPPLSLFFPLFSFPLFLFLRVSPNHPSRSIVSSRSFLREKRKNVVSSRTVPACLPHHRPPLRIDVAKANGERGGGWLVVGVGCRGSSSTSTLSHPVPLEPPSMHRSCLSLSLFSALSLSCLLSFPSTLPAWAAFSEERVAWGGIVYSR